MILQVGGHVIFTGYNNYGYGGMFPGAESYTDWCCGYQTNESQYFDFEHPLAEGVGDYFDTYRMFTTYLPDTAGIDILFNPQWWEYPYSHSTFTKRLEMVELR